MASSKHGKVGIDQAFRSPIRIYLPETLRVSRKACRTCRGQFEIPEKSFENSKNSNFTLYPPHTLDDGERERLGEESSDSSTNGDDSAASAAPIEPSVTLTAM